MTNTLSLRSARVLPDLNDQAQEIERLRRQIAELQSQPKGRVSFKVSEKGCVSIYGMNMRGIHLYASQWLKILEHADAIRAFIEANKSSLAWKEQP